MDRLQELCEGQILVGLVWDDFIKKVIFEHVLIIPFRWMSINKNLKMVPVVIMTVFFRIEN